MPTTQRLQPLTLPDGEVIPIRHINEMLWRRGDLEFLLWEQQFKIWAALNNIPPGVTEYVLLCARQYGKSTMGVMRALSRGIKNRDCCILIMGPDTKQTKDIVGPKMRFLLKTAPKGLVKQMKSENRYHIYHDLNSKSSDYTEIILGGMNENSSSQRGKTVQDIFVEEIVDVPEDNYLESMRSDLGPAMTHSKGGILHFLTTLPKTPDHPFITETMVKAELNKAISIFTIDDNIALSAQQKADCIDRAGGPNSNDTKREYYCIVVRDRNVVVLPDWEEIKNVGDVSLPEYLHMHVTIDWGGVRDKTVAVLHYYDYLTDTDIFWDERVFENHTASQDIIEACKEMERQYLGIRDRHFIHNRYIDAPAQFVEVDLHREPYNYHASVPIKPDFKSSVNTLNSRFKQGKAIIHSRCKFLILSARSGQFTKNKEDFARTDTLGHMDGCAAMMYAIRCRSTEDPYPATHIRTINTQFQNQVGTGIVQSSNSAPIVPKAFGRHRR